MKTKHIVSDMLSSNMRKAGGSQLLFLRKFALLLTLHIHGATHFWVGLLVGFGEPECFCDSVNPGRRLYLSH